MDVEQLRNTLHDMQEPICLSRHGGCGLVRVPAAHWDGLSASYLLDSAMKIR